MAIVFVILAGFFVAFSNFFMRKSIDCGGTTNGFLVFQMGVGGLMATLLNPIRTGHYEINLPIFLLGAVAGVILAVMLYSLGKALENGPAGFTFSIIASATVMPGLLMAALYGNEFGFPYTVWHAAGSMFVLGGLFWAGKGMEGLKDPKRWLFFSAAMFVLHTLLLALYQWRSLLLNAPKPHEILSSFNTTNIQSQWFSPCMFFVGCLLQIFIFWRSEHRLPFSKEIFYGVLGGIANALCTYFMLWGTEVALPLENAVIFPVFSVMSIVLTNLWGQKLYQEKVNWRACQVCIGGLVVGTVDWKTVISMIGFK